MIRPTIVGAVIVVLLVAQAGARSPQLAGEPPRVRIGLFLDQPVLRFEAETPITATDVLGGQVLTLVGGPWVVRPAPAGMAIPGTTLGPIARFAPVGGFLSVNGQAYRGAIEVRRTPAGRLTAINDLDLEQYLYGVIKGEIDPRWPPEAVKAQAVAARTLALENLAASSGKYAGEGYTLRATTDSQMYLGLRAEDPGAAAAVDATRGMVVTFRGQPIFAAYHSNSGGHTEDSENVWGTPHPYLRGVPDPYALNGPDEQWATRLPLAAVEAGLRRGGLSVTAIAAIEPGRMTPWGRAVTVRVVDEGGRTQEIGANQFRLLLGPTIVRSTMFVITREGGDISFKGRGSGHGVGLDQWGARAMALRGFTLEQILGYYYTGIAIERRY